ncbi:DUF6326 family protein [Patescibacteria group bacterium]
MLEKISEKLEIRMKLSTLWIVIMFNMLFADVLTLFIPESLNEIVSGTTAVEITPELMLVMALIIEIPILMIFLSRFLKRKINRWLNIVAAVITIAFVAGGGSLVPHYIFFAAIEVICALAIIWSSWKWAEESNE